LRDDIRGAFRGEKAIVSQNCGKDGRDVDQAVFQNVDHNVSQNCGGDARALVQKNVGCVVPALPFKGYKDDTWCVRRNDLVVVLAVRKPCADVINVVLMDVSWRVRTLFHI